MSEKEKSDFVVSDRRKFTETGDLRPDALAETREDRGREERSPSAEKSPSPENAESKDTPEQKARVESQVFTTEQAQNAVEPPPPTETEQQRQHEDYKAGAEKLDELLGGRAGKAASLEMTFERLVASLYMTAMLQMGLMAPEGEQPRVDILGARQTVDTLGVLNEKTKGNLTPVEQNLLQQSLFELRMAFVELTNAIAHAPAAHEPSGAKRK